VRWKRRHEKNRENRLSLVRTVGLGEMRFVSMVLGVLDLEADQAAFGIDGAMSTSLPWCRISFEPLEELNLFSGEKLGGRTVWDVFEASNANRRDLWIHRAMRAPLLEACP
jgi:hypothetical protein